MAWDGVLIGAENMWKHGLQKDGQNVNSLSICRSHTRHTSYEKLSTFRNNHAECFSNTSCTPAVSSCGTSQKWGHALRRSAHHRHTSPKHHPQNKPQAAPELAGHGKLIKYTRHSQSTEQRLIKAVRGLHSTTKNLVGMATHGTD